MTWWRNAWWVRVDNGPHLRTARGRRKVWRAATRAAQEVRETGRVVGGEKERWETESKGSNANVLHLTSSHQSRAGHARDRTDRKRIEGEMGARENKKGGKATPCTLSSISQPQTQQPQQQQQQQHVSRSITIRGQKAIMKERIWFDRVASEIVFQPLHPGTGASLHSERVIAVREEADLHLEFFH